MPAGLSKIRQLADEAAQRQAAYDASGPGVRFFKVDTKPEIVRFLEQGDDVKFFWVHELPKQPGQRYADKVLCLDQDDAGLPCPGCARQKKRSARVVINVLWYGAPKFEREPGQDGKPGKIKKDPASGAAIVNGTEDCVAVWNCSQSTGGRLDVLHNNSPQGLMMGVYSIGKRGAGRDTTYDIDRVEERQPNQAEMALYQSKGDPKAAIKEMSFGDLERAYSGGAGPVPAGAPTGAFAAAANDVQQRGAFGGAPVVAQPAPAGGGVNTGLFGAQQ